MLTSRHQTRGQVFSLNAGKACFFFGASAASKPTKMYNHERYTCCHIYDQVGCVVVKPSLKALDAGARWFETEYNEQHPGNTPFRGQEKAVVKKLHVALRNTPGIRSMCRQLILCADLRPTLLALCTTGLEPKQSSSWPLLEHICTLNNLCSDAGDLTALTDLCMSAPVLQRLHFRMNATVGNSRLEAVQQSFVRLTQCPSLVSVSLHLHASNDKYVCLASR